MYDSQKAKIAVRFFERMLKHTADDYYGKAFLLAPWQREALEKIFGNVDDDGNRLIQQVYLEVVKKAGKTEFVAGLLLLVLFMATVVEGKRGAQIYGAASTVKQALNVFRAACKMIEQEPLLEQHFRILRSTHRILSKADPDSFYEAIAGDGDASDGMNPLCAVVDEVHRWKTRKQLENWDVLSKGGITRTQTLTIGITTAGVQDESPLAWRLHEKTRKIAEGVVSDDRFYGRIYGASSTDNPGDPATWIKANPSLKINGGFLELDKIKQEYESSLAEGDLTSFKRYFLNIWDQKADRAIDMNQWHACRKTFTAAGLLEKAPEDKIRPLPHQLLAHFIERRCWIGVDLSDTTDLSAVVCVFPTADKGYEVLPFYWTPEDGVRKRELKDSMPYRQWAREGFIELSPGSIIDHRDIKERIKWCCQMFDVQEVVFDPAMAKQIGGQLNEEGFPVFQLRQDFANLNEPCREFLKLIITGNLHHGDHPILRWNASCVGADEKDELLKFRKPRRKSDSLRIDGVAAAVNGLARAMLDVGTINYTGLMSVGPGVRS